MVETLAVSPKLPEQELAKLEKPKFPFVVDFENRVLEVKQPLGGPAKVQFEINAAQRKITLHFPFEERPREFSFSSMSQKNRAAAKKSVIRELLLLTTPDTSLPKNGWSILSNYFGLVDGKGKTANEIADELGLKNYYRLGNIIQNSLRDLGLQDFYHEVFELALKRVKTGQTIKPIVYKNGAETLTGDYDNTQLVTLAQQGSEAAARELYRRYSVRIYSYILVRTGSEQEAEDLTQKILSISLTELSNYRERKNVPFEAWMFRIARNAIISNYRRRKKQPELVSFDATLVIQTRWGPRVFPENELLLKEVWQATATGVFADPAEVVENRLMLGELQQALEQLTEKQKKIIALRFVEGLAVKKTAKILRISAGNVKVTQHQAIAKLRDILQLSTGI